MVIDWVGATFSQTLLAEEEKQEKQHCRLKYQLYKQYLLS